MNSLVELQRLAYSRSVLAHRRVGLLAIAYTLFGCASGPVGQEYGCTPTQGCVCLSWATSPPDEIESCGSDCCFVRQVVRDNQTAYECSCDGAEGQYFDPPASVCISHPWAERVDGCPPTRSITDEPRTFSCFASADQHNEMVTGDGAPCPAQNSIGGCLTRLDPGGYATCISMSEGDECIGIVVTACDENLALRLTETVVEAWQCNMNTQLLGELSCACSGPHSKEVIDGWYDPIWTYPCPPIPDQCCRYSVQLRSCKCTTGEACADLSGVDVSACPVPTQELEGLMEEP